LISNTGSGSSGSSNQTIVVSKIANAKFQKLEQENEKEQKTFKQLT
jgi:hypothetical protein